MQPLRRGRAAAAAVCGTTVLLAVAAYTSGVSSSAAAPVALSTTSAISRLQAKLFVAQQHEHAYEGLEQAVTTSLGRFAMAKASHDEERQNLATQELLLDNVMAEAKHMATAEKTGKVQDFNTAVAHLNSGMTELKTLLSAANCPPRHGGQAALNMCLIKQQLGEAAMLRQGQTTPKGMAALSSALEGTEQTGRQLDRSDQRLQQDITAAKIQLQQHAQWGGQVLKEQGDFAKLAATYLPGQESRDLTQAWPKKPAAALSLLSSWMQKHDSWGLSSLAAIMKPQAPHTFDPTVSSTSGGR